MKTGNAVVTVLAIGAGLALLARHRGTGYYSVSVDRFSRINDLTPTPAQSTAHWAAAATGVPQTGQSAAGQGTVQSGSLAGRLASFWNFGTARRVWSAPTASTTTVPTKSSDPAGLQLFGNPSTPSTYTPQSQVRPQSLYLSPLMRLTSPLAFNASYQGLSGLDPYTAAAAMSGGYVDIQHSTTANRNTRWTSEHA